MKKKQYVWLAGDEGLGVFAEAPQDIDAAVEFLERTAEWGAKADAVLAEAPGELDARYVSLTEPLFGRGKLYDFSRYEHVVPSQPMGGEAGVDFAAAVSKKIDLKESIHVAPGGECELEFLTESGTGVWVPVETIAGVLRALRPCEAPEENAFGPKP